MNPAGSRTAGRTSSSRPSRFGFEGPPAPRPLRRSRNPGDVPRGRRLRVVERHRGSASPDGRHPETDPDPREALVEQGRGREAQPERRHADVAAAEVERRHGRQAGRADDQDGAARGQARGHQSPALTALAADRRDAGRSHAPAGTPEPARRRPRPPELRAPPRPDAPLPRPRAPRPPSSTTRPTRTTPRGATPWPSRDSRTTSRATRPPTSRTTPSTGSASRTSPRRNTRRRSPTSPTSSSAGRPATRRRRRS